MLLLACASVMATSRNRSDKVASPVHAGAPIRLTADAPKVTRTMVVRVSAKEKPAKPVAGELRIQAQAKWTPNDPAATAQPRLVITHFDTASNLGSQSGVLEPGVSVPVKSVGSLGSDCSMNSGCEWTVQVAFEVPANTVPGTADVEWTAQASAYVLGDSNVPKGFTVSLSEP
ncbi:hypothetical protein D7X55_15265 [Corallococcus sp. AB049A]|uniref:Uncharacterized protein n=1 Tax=Corallococcus interemptor TaxID=2316720 RepID=A0A3A8QBV3_9BACT|nr:MULTISPECIES: hypothetical protein [Corallococcus]RKH52229.1 hypothetical protein D7Y23_07515 [Corallococcus sp. AB050B]RKH66209.1 hypothetical protein D7X96_22195 [Corallococcus interemptor]RKI66175.1 hypothetical protein D7X55_15265 [Corallococcus sp. AB049A]